MKKIFTVLLIIVMMGFLACCGNTAPQEQTAEPEKGLKIVTTIFPEYDWVKTILGDKAADTELILLTDKGVDLHSFQPNAEDIMNISNCDVLIYVGGESDTFIEDALKGSDDTDIIKVNLLQALGSDAKEEETVEGMEKEDEEAENDDSEETEYDEHVWLSLRNAEKLMENICDAVCEADPVNADMYKANLDAYVKELEDLDKEYEEVITGASVDTLVFGDRFPFRYLTDDYGLNYFAAFKGCSAETEASFETVTFLAGKVDELGLDYIFTIENSDGKIARTIIDNTDTKDQEILVLDSMQSVVEEDIENGAAYLGIMRDNLDVLRKALYQK